jgi:hypothetical protein
VIPKNNLDFFAATEKEKNRGAAINPLQVALPKEQSQARISA